MKFNIQRHVSSHVSRSRLQTTSLTLYNFPPQLAEFLTFKVLDLRKNNLVAFRFQQTRMKMCGKRNISGKGDGTVFK